MDISDVEVVYPVNRYQPSVIDYYMRCVTLHLMGPGRDIKSGQPIDGPGERELSWVFEVPGASMVSPPRRVVRLFPKADAKTIRNAMGLPS